MEESLKLKFGTSKKIKTSPISLFTSKIALNHIAKTLGDYPFKDDPKISLFDFNKMNKNRDFLNITIQPLVGGMAVLYTSEGWLLDYSHCLLIPHKEPCSTKYRRECFNIDCQMIPPDALALNGVQQIAASQKARAELLFVSSELRNLKNNDWAY